MVLCSGCSVYHYVVTAAGNGEPSTAAGAEWSQVSAESAGRRSCPGLNWTVLPAVPRIPWYAERCRVSVRFTCLWHVATISVLTAIISVQGSHAYLKVLESTWKWGRCLKVLEFHWTGPWIHQVKLRDISNFVKQHSYRTGMHILSICQVFCLKQDLLIIVMFCFYQLKLYRNHTNRY